VNDSTTFFESRIRLPAQLLVQAAIFLVLAGFGSLVEPSASDYFFWRAVTLLGVIGAAGSVAWAGYRAARPAWVSTLGRNVIDLRSRRFDLGWTDKWVRRSFKADSVKTIEIGTRSDYPVTRSYRGTGRYIFIVVTVHGANGRDERYYYAPLQRIAEDSRFLSILRHHPLFHEKLIETN
jgi:hypothetical protein